MEANNFVINVFVWVIPYFHLVLPCSFSSIFLFIFSLNPPSSPTGGGKSPWGREGVLFIPSHVLIPVISLSFSLHIAGSEMWLIGSEALFSSLHSYETFS